jgi:subtilisin family serine protease
MERVPAPSNRRVSRFAAQLTVLIALVAPALPTAAGATPAPVDQRVLDQLASTGKATVWVMLRQRADLSGAGALADWTARGAYVVERLQATARPSQRGVVRFLRERGISYRSFWVVNAIRATLDRPAVGRLAAMAEVSRIRADGSIRVETPAAGPTRVATPLATGWNIDRIGAPEVWSTFGDRGQGIVVANIDTGVQFNHPALVRQYRGNIGSGFNHNYNWFDPSHACPNPAPCDNVPHGTHTMGIMVGEDAAKTNQIGVAPRARWIAAKGCENVSCSDFALAASGQWMLAPTNLAGGNPRPGLRPQVVNNSWGGGGGDPFYFDIVRAWVASGIFPVFSPGSSGPGCASVGSPGDYPLSYAAGAFDENDHIASFSSRGPSAFGGDIKPNIAAPGVDIRSSVPGGYAVYSGTSMSIPHVAGTVALMWSANPSLIGRVGTTRTLLDDSAVDVSDLSCGGTADDNNVWGEGRLDAFAAVEAALGSG